MLPDWNMLPDHVQIALAQSALRRVAETIADQAETLAEEMENGVLLDRGGPDALRLLAAVIRVNGDDGMDAVAGHA